MNRILMALMTLALLPLPAAAQDGDGDSIPDPLELALAQRFFPTLNLHCGSFEGMAYADRRQLYGHSVPGYPDSSAGKIPFVARPYNPGNGYDCAEPFQCIEIRYGMPWNWDLGDDSGLDSHPGDSEMYAILVARKDTDGADWGTTWAAAQNDASQWRLMREFMTAHWNTGSDSSTYRSHGNLGTQLHQRVWCAEGKHAMYPTQSACNNGGKWDADDCSDNRCDLRSDILPDLQNAGEYGKPLQRYIPYPATSKYYSPSGSYDVWSGAPFAEAGSFLSKLSKDRNLGWCAAHLYCAPIRFDGTAGCSPGDYEVGDCTTDTIHPRDGTLCQHIRCN